MMCPDMVKSTVYRSQLTVVDSPLTVDCGLSTLHRQHIVHGLPPADHAPASFVDEHFGGQRTTVVVRGHRGSVRSGVADRDQVVDLQLRQHAVASDDVAALADGSDDL